MNKSEFIIAIAESTGASKTQVNEIYEAIVQVAQNQVKEKGAFTLHNICILTKTDRPARTGRNPQTGAAMQIEAKTVVSAKVAGSTKKLFS